MSILKKVNEVRRKVMRGLTENVGKSTPAKAGALDGAVKRVLIVRPNNRLGNLLLITPLLQEVATVFPDCKVDLFTRGGLGPILFKNYNNVDRIIQLPKKPFKHLLDYAYGWISLKKHKYDIVINVVNYSSSGRLSTQFARSRFKFFADVDEATKLTHPDYQHTAKHAVYSFRKFLKDAGITVADTPVQPLNLKLTTKELDHGKKLLEDLTKNQKKTISIFTYATGAKCYPESWWMPFYERLQKEFPDYNIIEILPAENVSQIGFKAPTFYSRDIRDIGAVIANTAVFIGADSGIMHLSAAVHAPTVGLFWVTNPEVYGPYGNNSTAINTNETTTEQWIATIKEILGRQNPVV
jgi:ADP-heptose:LPS heptosyltransferase